MIFVRERFSKISSRRNTSQYVARWYTNIIFDHENIITEKIIYNKTKLTRKLILDYQKNYKIIKYIINGIVLVYERNIIL